MPHPSRTQKRHRVFCLLLAFLVAGFAITASPVAGPQTATAQEGGEAAADNGDANSGESRKETRLISWIFNALSWYYIVIFLLISFTFVALFVMNLLAARRDNVCPSHLIDGFEAHLNEKRYQEAYEMAKADESFLGNVLSSGLAKLSSGYAQAIEAMQEVGEEENMKLEHRLSYIALIGTISPMVGLFGTVDGMIRAFYDIAASGSTPDHIKLANDISRALLTTLLGLGIAIPAIAVFNILRNRAQRLVLEVGIVSEGLMSRFQNVGGGKSQPQQP